MYHVIIIIKLLMSSLLVPDIHAARPHKGQMKVARNLLSLLASDVHPSEISESHRFCDRVQDAYTLRCCPQVTHLNKSLKLN